MSSHPTATLKGRSIGQRLGAVLGLVLLISFGGSALGYWALYKVAVESEVIYQDSLVTERAASDWYRNITNGVNRTSAIAISADTSLADFFAAGAAESTKQSSELQKQLELLMTSPEEKTMFAALSEARKAYLGARDAVTAAKKSGDADGARQLFDSKFQPAAQQFQEQIKAIVVLQRKQLDEAAQRIESNNGTARAGLVMFALCAAAVGLGLALWLTRSITRPLQEAVGAAEAIANFDLSHPIPTGGADETGQLLNSLRMMQAALLKLIGEVRSSTDSISTASAEIATGNHDLSART